VALRMMIDTSSSARKRSTRVHSAACGRPGGMGGHVPSAAVADSTSRPRSSGTDHGPPKKSISASRSLLSVVPITFGARGVFQGHGQLAENVRRERRTDSDLAACGWMVLRFWKHEDPVAVADAIFARLGQLRGSQTDAGAELSSRSAP
jgi:hypothetical protein